jgi:purine catabolism regulator
MTSVRQVLELPSLAGSYVAAGAPGLGRLVTGGNVMEVPDIENYVAPGELLLTTGYPLRDRTDGLTGFVSAMARRGVSAIGIKPGRFLGGLPPELIRAADQWALPVLVLPDDASFNVILTDVLSSIAARPGVADAGGIEMRLTQAALGGGGLPAMAESLGIVLQRSVRIVDQGRVLAESSVAPGVPVEPWNDAMAQSWPVRVSGTERGRIQVAGLDGLTAAQADLVRLACFAVAMHMAQAQAQLELQRRQLVLYLEELVSGLFDPQVYAERAALFHWPAGPFAVVLSQAREDLDDAAVVTAARTHLPRALAWARGSEAVAIVPVGRTGVGRDRLTAWHRALSAIGGGAVVTVEGSVAAGADGLAGSHAHAREAAVLARTAGSPVARFADLTIERLILAVPDDVRRDFVTGVIGPLVEADRVHGSHLCDTVHEYLQTGNAALAARHLYIHYNTMKARLNRARSLLGDSLDSPRGRVAVLLALEAHKARSARPSDRST